MRQEKEENNLGGINQELHLGVTGAQSYWDPSKKQCETQLRIVPPKGEKAGVIINASHCLRVTPGLLTPWYYQLTPHGRAKHTSRVEKALRLREMQEANGPCGNYHFHMNSRVCQGDKSRAWIHLPWCLPCTAHHHAPH